MASTIIPLIAEAGIGYLDTVLIQNKRSIAGVLFPDVVIEERHTDELEITRHPVEQGATISDHAFKRPAGLVMHLGWSNSSSFATLITGNVQDMYQQLLDLQATREPFDVVTGKRIYQNMLISMLVVSTTRESENALMVEAHFEEVIIVSTQTAVLSPLSSQANPGDTGAPVDTGTAQPKAVDGSILSNAPDAIKNVLKNIGIPISQ